MNIAKSPSELTPQSLIVLKHLAAGKVLDRAGAMLHYGIQNLTARIADLRSAGFDVRCRMEADMNGREHGVWFVDQREQRWVKSMYSYLFL